MNDFSTVKGIVIPEGNVKSISVGGRVIWKKQEDVKLGVCTVVDALYFGASYEGDITFVVGMTWQQFCDSDYNTYGFYCANNLVKEPNGCHLVQAYPTSKIIEGYEYEWDMLSGW
jgi:hypothetical protein